MEMKNLKFLIFIIFYLACSTNSIKTRTPSQDFLADPFGFMAKNAISTRAIDKLVGEKKPLLDGVHDFELVYDKGYKAYMLTPSAHGPIKAHWIGTDSKAIIKDFSVPFIFTTELTGCSVFANWFKDGHLEIYHSRKCSKELMEEYKNHVSFIPDILSDHEHEEYVKKHQLGTGTILLHYNKHWLYAYQRVVFDMTNVYAGKSKTPTVISHTKATTKFIIESTNNKKLKK